MADEFMHVRAMTLLEFGCPPLPIADGRRMETSEAAIINSHDLLSVFMAQAFKGQDAKRNNTRKERQVSIEEEYYQRLVNSDGTFESVYGSMAEYTRSYLGTFLLPPFSTEDVRILPPDYISPALRADIRDYTSALQVVHGDTTPRDQNSSLQADFKTIHRILSRAEAQSLPHQAKDDRQSLEILPDVNPIETLDNTNGE
jgi:hypothetical protein